MCVYVSIDAKLLGAWPLSEEEPIEISGLSYAQVKKWIADRDERWSAEYTPSPRPQL